jgi:hypothetical protein
VELARAGPIRQCEFVSKRFSAWVRSTEGVSESVQPAAVGTTAAPNEVPPICGGPLDLRAEDEMASALRAATPEQVGEVDVAPSRFEDSPQSTRVAMMNSFYSSVLRVLHELPQLNSESSSAP